MVHLIIQLTECLRQCFRLERPAIKSLVGLHPKVASTNRRFEFQTNSAFTDAAVWW